MGNDDDRITADPIQMYASQVLRDGLGIITQVRAGLTPEDHKTTLILEGQKFYDAGVRAVYDALCMLTVDGVEHVDRDQIVALKRGLEDYIVKGRKIWPS
ncbi:MAG: hypothetical protein AABY00_03000 [Nanoarchaeota archaeon]